MGFILSRRSLKNLEGVHADLVRVVERALEITSVDFVVTEGLRSVERQEQLVKSGASKTRRSRHLTGHAVDVAAWVTLPDPTVPYLTTKSSPCLTLPYPAGPDPTTP